MNKIKKPKVQKVPKNTDSFKMLTDREHVRLRPRYVYS